MGKGPTFTSEANAVIEELRAAKERAESANRAKSEFLGVVSHELRLPLTGILGMAHMLDLECLLPAQHEQVVDIIKSSEHLLALVDDLLDLAKLEMGKIELKPAPLNLREVLEETATMLMYQTHSKGLKLLISYEEETPQHVIADARALRQIIINLVGNALKFTEQGYILIRVKCLSQAQSQAQIELSIEDTGLGIVKDKLKMIFNHFQQSDSAGYHHRYDDIGLGLTISKAYVELMGGTITAQSQLGKGSIFSCVIPFQLQAVPEELTAKNNPKVSKAERASQRAENTKNVSPPSRILLVEDDPIVQKVHRMMLERAGYKVDVAEDGVRALQMFSADYNAVLMDVGLPDLSGLEVVIKLRKQEGKNKRIPIIALTAYAHAEDKNNCLAAGMDDVLTKPASYSELTETLQRWLPKR